MDQNQNQRNRTKSQERKGNKQQYTKSYLFASGHDDEMLGTLRSLWPLTLLHLCLTVLGSPIELFDEHLTLRTLQDGKVASKFTFTTFLKGASPRDPKTLDTSDECTLPPFSSLHWI